MFDANKLLSFSFCLMEKKIKVGNAAPGATQKMGFVRSQGSAGTETTPDPCIDGSLDPVGFATLFP